MPKDKHGVPSLREMVVSKTYPGAPSGIRITVFPTRSVSHPDKFSLFSSTQNAYFGTLRDTFQEAVEGANKENIRMYGKPEVPREPVKGEQAGMLGVPSKVHTQKQPYKAGQMEFESYAKYKETMPSTIDLRKDYDEKAEVEGGMLYRQGNIIQVWWEASGKETWTNPSVSEARRNFKEMTDRWSRRQAEQTDLHWKTVAELRQMCSQRGLPTDGGKEDLIRRLK